MPAINPNDYNIDSFNSQNLGPITVSDFREYVLNHNLPGIDPLVIEYGYSDYGLNIYAPLLFNPTNNVQDIPDLTTVSFTPSVYNNSTSPRPDNLKQNIWKTDDPFYGSPKDEETFEVTSKALENPGSIDSWLNEGGFETDVFTIRNFVHLTNNEYGPEFVYDYSDPESFPDSTGYQQYPTSSGGDGSGIIGSIIGRTLGFSTTNFINFPSDLQDIARERRGVELENRIKLNFIEDTLGNINLDPLGLLAGQSLITPNYTITRPKNFIGRVAQFTANLANFNVPTSIIPGDDRTKLSSNGFQEDLIDFTGKGQKDLLYFNVYSSKYVPEALTKGWNPDDTTKDTILGRIGQFFDDLGKSEGDTYLSISQTTTTENQTLSQKIGNLFNDLITPNSDKSLIPEPEKSTSPNDPFVTMGTEGQYPSIDSLDVNSSFVESDYVVPSVRIAGATTEYYDNKTTLQPGFLDQTTAQSPSTIKNFDWRNRNTQVAKRGILKFTQDMINKAEVNGHRGGAKFIGRFDSDSNLTSVTTKAGNDRLRHQEVSKGNLVRSSDNSHYCRSWSTRNPYQNHDDLIRADRLYRLRNETNYLSVLEDNGHVKIAPYVTDDNEKGSDTISKIEVNVGNDVKRYMFSIENLAWIDAKEKIGLRDCELGPNGGRIMWFPPYEIAFTENTSTNWETNTLLGRGEPIYTYNSTERKGTLSWAIVTDHPSSMKFMRNETEEELYKYFAGCGITEERLNEIFGTKIIEKVNVLKTQKEEEDKENSKTENELDENNDENPKPVYEPQEPPIKNLNAYFRNAGTDELIGGVRSGIGRNITEELSVNYALASCDNPDCIINSPANFVGQRFDKNQKFVDEIQDLVDFLSTEGGQAWGIKIEGNTSGAANKEYNRILSRDRAEGVYEYILNELNSFTIPPSAGVGVTGETKYIPFEKQKKDVKRGGWFCTDPDQNKCKSETAKRVGNKLTYDQKLTYSQPNEIKEEGRFIVIANSEASSSSNKIGTEQSDEDAIVGNTNKNSAAAMEDRKVVITLYKNKKYIDQITAKEKESPINLDLTVDEDNIQKPTIPFLSPFEQQFLDQNIEAQQQLDLINDFQKFKGFAGKDLIDRQSDYTDRSKQNTGTDEPIDESPIGENVEDNNVDDETLRNVIRVAVDELYTECDYFAKIEKKDPFIYQTLVEKLKYFHPAFHSTTPEGLNDRLTFLNQCMRQGPNIQTAEDKTKNLAFGRPPVCVLRIGDFWYTKIIIDSFNINYEPLVWDMNPEGIGVQPMIAKVDLNFSMIGGSSLDGPIKQLQNAVSFNYYANTSVYNSRRYYSNKDNGNTFKTLEERLAAINDELNNDEIGFGAFKSQNDANKERYKTTNPEANLVETENDKIDQTEDVIETPTLPLKPFSKVEGGVGDSIQGIVVSESAFIGPVPESQTLFPNALFVNEQNIKETYVGAQTPSDQVNNILYKVYTDNTDKEKIPFSSIFIELTSNAQKTDKPWDLFIADNVKINGVDISLDAWLEYNYSYYTIKDGNGDDVNLINKIEFTNVGTILYEILEQNYETVSDYKLEIDFNLYPTYKTDDGQIVKSGSGGNPTTTPDGRKYTLERYSKIFKPEYKGPLNYSLL